MKEFFICLKKMDWYAIFIIPTTNGFLQFIRYGFVGGIATLVDWGVLHVLTQAGLYYMISAVFGFIAGLLVNFVLSKWLVFQASKAKTGSFLEFLSYGLIGIIGLGLTMVILYVFTEIVGVYYMLSKMIATILTLIWNYLARKKLLYQ